MSKYVENIRTTNNDFIRISNYHDDPCSWVVRKYKKGLLWNRRISSVWFMDEIQARKYVKKLVGNLEGF